MQRRDRHLIIPVAVLCALMILFLPFCGALATEAAAYDPNRPEILAEENLRARAAVLISADSGDIVFEKNAKDIMFPASTTKIMTVYLGIIWASANGIIDEPVRINPSAFWDITEDSSIIRYGRNRDKLQVGDVITMRDLLYATLIQSGNDGANIIAENLSPDGSVSGYVRLMNEMAYSMGCTSTNFINPHGLHDPDHYSSAADLALIAKTAMMDKNPDNFFPDIANKYRYTITVNGESHSIENGNYDILNPDSEYYYYLANGIKTGNTEAAGQCFVGSAMADGVHLISVILNGGRSDRWRDTIRLMNYGFSQFESVSPVDLYARNPIEIEVKGYSLNDTQLGKTKLSITPRDPMVRAVVAVPKNDVAEYARTFHSNVMITYTRDLVAPIEAGDVVGTLTYFNPNNNNEPIVYDLTADRSVAMRENAPKTLEQIVRETFEDANPLPPFSLELLFMALIPLAAVFLLVRFILRLTGKLKGKRKKLPKRVTRRYN